MELFVELNVGGQKFKTKRSTLKSIQGSYLSSLDFSKNSTLDFDRDPYLFRHILNAHRDCVVHVPRDVCPSLFKQELLFWKIPFKLIAPCCWKHMYETKDETETLNILLEEGNRYAQNKIDYTQESIKASMFTKEWEKDMNDRVDREQPTKETTIASKLWLFLEEPASSTAAKIWLFFYILVVIVSVVVYIIWVEPFVRVPMYLGETSVQVDIFTNHTIREFFVATYNEKLVYLALSDPHPALFSAEIFCVVFFILETLVHFCVCPQKLRYCLNPYHVLKIILCITMTISTFFEFRKDLFHINDYAVGQFYYGCKSLNVLRLLLIFRLHKIYNGLHIMLLSLKHSSKELALLMFSFLVAVVVYGCLVFSAEIESDMFSSTQIAMWWSLITMTTIGYGDFYPVSTWGYVVGIICAINGIIVLALPIAAIASTFSVFYTRSGDLRKHLAEVRKQEIDTLASTKPDTVNLKSTTEDKHCENGKVTLMPLY